MTGHLPSVSGGDDATRAAFAADPRSGWRNDQGRDVIYEALGVPTKPTRPATGVYTPPGGVREVNPSQVARPQIELAGPEGARQVAPHSRAQLDAAEGARAYIDAQGAGAWHAPIRNSADRSGSVSVPGSEKPLMPDQIAELERIGTRHGIGDVIDTGGGATMTRFDTPPSADRVGRALQSGRLRQDIGDVLGDRTIEPRKVEIDPGYVGYEDAWAVGHGAATRQLQEIVQRPDFPDLLSRLDASPEIRAGVAARSARDAEASALTGDPIRVDIQRAREVTSRAGFTGLFQALRRGEALPVVALPALYAAVQLAPNSAAPSGE